MKIKHRDRAWHIVGSEHVLVLLPQEEEQRGLVSWETKHGTKLNLEEPNQVRTGPLSKLSRKIRTGNWLQPRQKPSSLAAVGDDKNLAVWPRWGRAAARRGVWALLPSVRPGAE